MNRQRLLPLPVQPILLMSWWNCFRYLSGWDNCDNKMCQRKPLLINIFGCMSFVLQLIHCNRHFSASNWWTETLLLCMMRTSFISITLSPDIYQILNVRQRSQHYNYDENINSLWLNKKISYLSSSWFLILIKLFSLLKNK